MIGALHVDVDAHLHAAVLQGADHLQAGAVADVAQALESVAAESALQDSAIVGAIEKRAPLLEFAHAVRRFLRVELRHAPVVEEFSAAHGVAEVRAPVVGGIHVGHGRGDSAFGHHGVRFAQQRFANDANVRALRQRFDRRAQSRAARADDQNIMFVSFEFAVHRIGHRILRSLMAPLATRRT